MKVGYKDNSTLGKEACALLLEEANYYPLARLINVIIDVDPNNLDLLSFKAWSIACDPGSFVTCETPIAVLRTKDGLNQFFQQMLVVVALIDERKKPKDEPLKPKVHLPKG